MKTLFSAALASAALLLAGAEPPVTLPGISISLDGTKEKVKLVPGEYKNLSRYANPPWGKAETRDYMIVALKSTPMDGDWEAAEFSFTPASDGTIRIILSGKWYKNTDTGKIEELWVGYDNFQVTGAKLENPDFENRKQDGSPANWIRTRALLSADGPQSGKYFLAAASQSLAWQFFQVKKGEKVTVRFYAKPLEEKPGK